MSELLSELLDGSPIGFSSAGLLDIHFPIAFSWASLLDVRCFD
jgi:hypothetical protein